MRMKKYLGWIMGLVFSAVIYFVAQKVSVACALSILGFYIFIIWWHTDENTRERMRDEI